MDDVLEPASRTQLDKFMSDVLNGLSHPQKTLPCQYFYDEAGSILFEQITELPEYYPTRTEVQILDENAEAISRQLGKGVLLVEYGAGASTKTRIILDALESPAGYVPIDVSKDFLLQTTDRLQTEYPDLSIDPIVGDFMTDFGLPPNIEGNPVGFFPGSTIGNLTDPEIRQFMRAARSLLGHDGHFLIGLDLRKSPAILIPAYDDAAGVTAAFNLNLLTRINRELGADFNLDGFEHRAIWNDAASRIEMHLRSRHAQVVDLAGRKIAFAENETIHTENSRKFDLDEFLQLVGPTGWSLREKWLDERQFFAVVLLSATKTV